MTLKNVFLKTRRPTFSPTIKWFFLLTIFTLINLNLQITKAEEPIQTQIDTTATSTALENQLPADLLQIANAEAFSRYVLLVDKKIRKLYVFERQGEGIRKIDEIPADIGKSEGNKTQRDDHRTPEGIYFFQKKLTQPEIPFSLYGKMAFTTDYPNLFDRRARKTGSGIWLHSIPESVPLTRGSRGCVVIRNSALEKIAGYIKLKETPLIIYDEIKFISQTEHEQKRKEISTYIESWRTAWEAKDIQKYLQYYDESFDAPGFKNLNLWGKHKSRLRQERDEIKINLYQPFVLLHNDSLIIKTLQKYISNLHSDYGVKVIYAKKSPDGTYKILREEWTPSNEQGEISISAANNNNG